MQSKKRTLKNRILKAVMAVVFFLWALSLCLIESQTKIPLIVFCVTFVILLVFAFVNRNWSGLK